MKVIGIKKREGDFVSPDTKQNIHYVSYDVYYQDPNVQNAYGVIVEKLTFQEKAMINLLENKKITSVDKLLGLEFNDIYYNQSKKPVQLL